MEIVSSGAAIEARGLLKRYGDVVALDGIDLGVPAGTVYGLLGPNGAGKTTAVRIFTTLLPPDEGEARVGGLDVVRDAGRVRERIGLSGQTAAVDEQLERGELLREFITKADEEINSREARGNRFSSLAAATTEPEPTTFAAHVLERQLAVFHHFFAARADLHAFPDGRDTCGLQEPPAFDVHNAHAAVARRR